MKAGRAVDEDWIAEDQFQAVVVGQVMAGGKPELSAAPGDHVPIPPGPVRELDRSMRSIDIHRGSIPFEQTDRLPTGHEGAT